MKKLSTDIQYPTKGETVLQGDKPAGRGQQLHHEWANRREQVKQEELERQQRSWSAQK
jgi:hypothetical protein